MTLEHLHSLHIPVRLSHLKERFISSSAESGSPLHLDRHSEMNLSLSNLSGMSTLSNVKEIENEDDDENDENRLIEEDQ
jgi:hypothetical protein